MRLKLVVLASLLAAVAGAGSCIALVLVVFSRQALSSPGLLVLSTFLLPLATIIFASIFVYRHTARRRRLQAFLTEVGHVHLRAGDVNQIDRRAWWCITIRQTRQAPVAAFIKKRIANHSFPAR